MLELKPERVGLQDFDSHTIVLAGRSVVLDVSGAVFLPGTRALVVADMHLEKGSASAARGTLLPPYDSRDTLIRLAKTIDRYEAETVVALGDSFHDNRAPERLGGEEREILRIIQEDCRWIWLTGNHDPVIPASVGGEAVDSLRLDGLDFRHVPSRGPVTHEIAGHLHPAARLVLAGSTLRRACFVGNGRRLVMPAFGTYTGGLNILDPAFEPIFGDDGLDVWMLGQEGLYPIAPRLLRGD